MGNESRKELSQAVCGTLVPMCKPSRTLISLLSGLVQSSLSHLSLPLMFHILEGTSGST